MQTVIRVTLSGYSKPFQLEEGAYKALKGYLHQSRSRLKRDPDREEVLRDLEQSIGEKLAKSLRAENRVINRREVEVVLDEVGAVNTGNVDAEDTVRFSRPRRLCRVEQGRWFFGVCKGLAVYSGIGVEWVRSLFVIASVFSGGLPILIYLILAVALPIVRTNDDYHAILREHSGAFS